MHARELFDEIVMNKAFTKEPDNADDDDPQLPALPPGGKITSHRKVMPAFGPQLIYWVILARCALSTDGVLRRLRSAASS